jgi:pilus assembly protein CpaB
MKSIAHAISDRSPAAISVESEFGSKSRRALMLAALFGLVGAALLMFYLRRFEEEVSGGGRVALVTVREPIARGALVTAQMLTVTTVPRAYVEQRAVRLADRDKVIGVRAAGPLAPQDTLLWSDLALATEDRDLSSLVQPGKRAVTVRASEAGSDPAGNGLLRPGDYVDVIVTMKGEMGGSGASAIVLLQRVLVLAVGSQTEPNSFADGRAERRNSLERELTLSLRLEEVQLLSLARERGILSVALRAPNDAKVIENIADVPASSLYDKVVRETVQHRPAPPPPAATPSVPTPVHVPGQGRR